MFTFETTHAFCIAFGLERSKEFCIRLGRDAGSDV